MSHLLPAASSGPDDELSLLIAAVCDETASQEQYEQLEALLRNDAHARSCYLSYARVHAALQLRTRRGALMTDVMQNMSNDDGNASNPTDKPVAVSCPPITQPGKPVTPISWEGQSKKPPQFGPSEPIWPGSSQSSILDGFLRSALSFLTVPVVLLLITVGFVSGAATGIWWLGRGATDASDRVAFAEPRATPVAYLALANGCGWGKSSAQVHTVGSAVNSGDELLLLEGIAEFRLSSGVSLSVEGPASLVLASQNLLILQQGKLTAHVPWRAADFQILAGASRLTAIDTELGIQVFGGSTDIHVFSGEVTATLSPHSINEEGLVVGDADLDEDDVIKLSPVVIKESEAVEFTAISNGKTAMRRYEAESSQFASRGSMAGQLPITPRYIEAVKKSMPVAYWRFETVENKAIRNEISTGCPLKVSGELSLLGDTANHVLQTGGIFDEDHLVSSEPMDQFFNGDFSVELWVKPSHYHRGDLVSVAEKCYSPMPAAVGSKSADLGYGFRLVMHPDFGITPGTVAYAIMNPSQQFTAVRCCSGNLYKLRAWQHVVAVGGTRGAKFYLDGKEVGLVKHFKKVVLAPGQRLAVGRAHPHLETNFFPFVGQLDELAIYDHVLSSEDILEHFKAVNEPASETKQPLRSPEQKPAAKTTASVNHS